MKVYDATIQMGASTTTGDPEGDTLETAPLPDWSNVEEVLKGFVGPQMQSPPAYSAVKYKGRPLYSMLEREIPFHCLHVRFICMVCN